MYCTYFELARRSRSRQRSECQASMRQELQHLPFFRGSEAEPSRPPRYISAAVVKDLRDNPPTGERADTISAIRKANFRASQPCSSAHAGHSYGFCLELDGDAVHA